MIHPFKETVVIQPYYKKMKTVKKNSNHVFSIDKQKINTDKIYISYSLYQKIKGHIHLTGTMQVLKNNEFEFVEIPFELSNADTKLIRILVIAIRNQLKISFIFHKISIKKSSINVYLMPRINQMSIS